jgi:hypothetical protein
MAFSLSHYESFSEVDRGALCHDQPPNIFPGVVLDKIHFLFILGGYNR